MKEAKKNIHVTLQLLFFVLVVVSVLVVNEPLLTTFFMGLWIGFLMFNIMTLVKYRIGKADFILLPTNQDQFAKTNALVLGFFVIAISIISNIWFPLFDDFLSIGLGIGSLMVIGSLIAVPLGIFKAANDKLELYGQKDGINIDQVKEIHLFNDQLTVVPFFGARVHILDLQLTYGYAERVEKYLSKSDKAAHIVVKKFIE